MNLLEHFAAHEQLSDYDEPGSEYPKEIRGDDHSPEGLAKARAKLRFIRARAMVEEAEKQQPAVAHYKGAPFDARLAAKTTGLSFSEALMAMKEGKRVGLFGSETTWCSDGKTLFIIGTCPIEACPSVEDIMADGWEVVP